MYPYTMRILHFALVAAAVVAVACSSSDPAAPPVVTPDAAAQDSGAETSAPCGSAGAAKCEVGEACSAHLMCASANCVSNRCAASSCSNGRRDGDETGTDCGGGCTEKCDGEVCTAPSGCRSKLCVGNVCAPSGTKTCGVGTGKSCENGEECSQAADCSSDFCSINGLCEAPSSTAHEDGVRNAGETGVDCGGTIAATKLCGAGQACKVSDDCLGVCPAGGGLCAAPNATDGKKNQGETDVDCGGANAPPCMLSKACATSNDCTLKYCSAAKVCTTPTSTDGIKNGLETDTDCGGGTLTEGAVSYTAPRCDLKKKCAADADCGSAVCAEGNLCIEAPSCRPIHGGQTCGVGEYGQGGAQHESCCRSLPTGITTTLNGVTKQVYLDKYEITAGRVRAWLDDLSARGETNVQARIKAKMATDDVLKKYFPGTFADSLPTGPSTPMQTFPVHPTNGGGTVTLSMGIDNQVSGSSYYREVQLSADGTNIGCWNAPGAYGHRTLIRQASSALYPQEAVPTAAMVTIMDEKSMNCMTPIMFAAFCEWDGGYMQSTAALSAAYGTATQNSNLWPWGSNSPATSPLLGNYNTNNSFNATKAPRYLYPAVDYSTFATNLAPIIAAPGRFPNDIASVARPGVESWMDLGSNMLEWSYNGTAYAGWTGSSFEGHLSGYGATWGGGIYFLDKYGKGGTRCMRLK